DAVFGAGYQSALTSLVKNRRSIPEYLENPELKQELTAIHEMYDEEMKKKKKELKLAQKENGTLIDDDEDELEAEKEDPVEPEDQSLKHIMVEGDDPSLPFKNPKDGFTEKGIQMKDRLAHFKKQAQRKDSAKDDEEEHRDDQPKPKAKAKSKGKNPKPEKPEDDDAEEVEEPASVAEETDDDQE
ncbi:unnamed protein product, partial [Durusdinium trenchii]